MVIINFLLFYLLFSRDNDTIILGVLFTFILKCVSEGMNEMPQITTTQREKAYALLKADADKILRLIEVQIDNLMTPQCPLYEEVLDTQMFGLSREIDFAVRLDLVTGEQGRELLDNLEHKLTMLHETAQDTPEFNK